MVVADGMIQIPGLVPNLHPASVLRTNIWVVLV